MSDNKPDSEQTSLTNRPIVAGTTVSSTDHEAWRNDIEGRIDDLIAGLKDNSNHRAGTSAPTDNTVECQIWGDITNDPAVLKFDPDGSGADIQLLSVTEDGAVWPSFHAHRNTVTQDNITGIDKVEFTTETFDTNSDYDKDTNFRFTPTVAGKYQVTAAIRWQSLTAGDVLNLFIYKGVGIYASHIITASAADESQHITTIVDMNGSTDYLEVFAANDTRNTADISGVVAASYFCASRIA